MIHGGDLLPGDSSYRLGGDRAGDCAQDARKARHGGQPLGCRLSLQSNNEVVWAPHSMHGFDASEATEKPGDGESLPFVCLIR
jgi:hypothetical protein